MFNRKKALPKMISKIFLKELIQGLKKEIKIKGYYNAKDYKNNLDRVSSFFNEITLQPKLFLSYIVAKHRQHSHFENVDDECKVIAKKMKPEYLIVANQKRMREWWMF